LESLIRILVGIPFGVFVHRGWNKAILLYFYCFVGLFVACTIVDSTRAAKVWLELSLAEYVVSLLQVSFGAGTGVLLSTCEKYFR